MLRTLTLAGTVASVAILAAFPAFAGTAATQADIDALKREMTAQIEYLKQQLVRLDQQQQASAAKQQATDKKVESSVAAVQKVTPPKGRKGVQIGG